MADVMDDHEQQSVGHGLGAQGCSARLRSVAKDQPRSFAEPSAGLTLASGGVPDESLEPLEREPHPASVKSILNAGPRPLIKQRQQNRGPARHHQRAPVGRLDDLAQR
jgi:hypothetical protein